MAEKKNTHQHIEALNAGLSREKIRGLKDKLKTGEVIEPESRKAEVNAMTAMYIEEIWASTVNAINTHPPGLMKSRKEFGDEETYLTTEAADEKYLNDPDAIAPWVFDQLKTYTTNLVREEVKKWGDAKEESLLLDPKDRSGQIFARYKQILKDNPNIIDPAEAFPESHIQRGVGTATKIIWNIFQVMPQVYKSRFGEVISSEQFKKVAKNSLPLIYAIAGSHLGVFGKVHDAAKKDVGLGFEPIHFFLEGEGDSMKLEMQPQVLNSIEIDSSNFVGPRTGCPAIFSEGPSRKNVIAEMYDWMLDLAGKYYVPNLEK